MGVSTERIRKGARGVAAPSNFTGKHSASTPIPALPPWRGKGIQNGLKHPPPIIEHLPIAEPEHPITLAREPGVADRIMQLLFGQVVPTTIHFNDQTRAQAGEVRDIATDRDLSAKPEVEPAQTGPQQSFRQRHHPPQIARAPNGALG